MKRRIDDLGGRAESISGIVGSGGAVVGTAVTIGQNNQGNTANNSLGGYVRGSTVNPTIGRGAGNPVPPVSGSTVSPNTPPITHDHPSHNPAQTGE